MWLKSRAPLALMVAYDKEASKHNLNSDKTSELKLQPDRTRVLFFSRGRGCGHIIPDLAIVTELRKIRSDFDLRFVTYGAGADTLRQLGHRFFDLGLTEENPVIETLILSAQLVDEYKPALVVAHEEFPALPATRIFGTPTVFITDWFASSKEYSYSEEFAMGLLDYADEILFTDEAGIFEEPDQAKGRVFYAGPALRQFSYCGEDRDHARTELGFLLDETVISVFPGSFTEEEAPIWDLTLRAFDLLHAPSKRLIWLAGKDYEQLRTLTNDRPDVNVLERDWKIDRLMVATDVAITKATRNTMLELAALGIPSISVFCGKNRYDHVRASHIRSNIAFDISSLDSSTLARHLATRLANSRELSTVARPPNAGNGRVVAAERLSFHIGNVQRKERESARTVS